MKNLRPKCPRSLNKSNNVSVNIMFLLYQNYELVLNEHLKFSPVDKHASACDRMQICEVQNLERTWKIEFKKAPLG